MKNIVTVVYNKYYSDPRATKFANTLSEYYNVTVISLEEKVKEHEIKNVNHLFIKSLRISIVNLFCFWFRAIRLIISIKPEIILAHNYFVLFPCVLASKIIKAKCVYDSYEFYVPSRRCKISFRQRFFYILEQLSIQQCKLVYSANNERARLMKIKFKLKTLPVSILNISAYKQMDFTTNSSIKTKYNILKNDKIKIVYQGYISFERELDKYIDLLKELPDNFELYLVGGGAHLERLKDLIVDKKQEKRIFCLGEVPMKDIIPIVNSCDIGIVTYPFLDYNNAYCSPNKIFEYSLAKRPFISSKQATIRSIMNDVDYVCYINIAKPEEAANLILSFIKKYHYNELMFNKFNERHTWDNEKNKILHSIVNI